MFVVDTYCTVSRVDDDIRSCSSCCCMRRRANTLGVVEDTSGSCSDTESIDNQAVASA